MPFLKITPMKNSDYGRVSKARRRVMGEMKRQQSFEERQMRRYVSD
jgi:hypothetical protein